MDLNKSHNSFALLSISLLLADQQEWQKHTSRRSEVFYYGKRVHLKFIIWALKYKKIFIYKYK